MTGYPYYMSTNEAALAVTNADSTAWNPRPTRTAVPVGRTGGARKRRRKNQLAKASRRRNRK